MKNTHKLIIVFVIMTVSIFATVWIISGKSTEEWACYHAVYVVEDFYIQYDSVEVKYYKVETIDENNFIVYVNVYIFRHSSKYHLASEEVELRFEGGSLSDRNNWIIDW